MSATTIFDTDGTPPPPPGGDDASVDEPRLDLRPLRTTGDKVYRGLATGAGLLTLLLMGLIGLFLVIRALPALRESGLVNFLLEVDFSPQSSDDFGIAAILYGTFVIAVVALLLAVPVSIALALFINEYAPRRLRTGLTSLIDLLAAVPSLIYGLWGFFYLQPRLGGFSRWLTDHVGFLPVFEIPVDRTSSDPATYTGSAFNAGVVVSLMVLPIATSVMREVFSQAPPGEKEAALALGGTRWGMIRSVVLPFGRGGMIGGSMLGLGRALGETIAVSLIISPIFFITPQVLANGGNSIAALIALRFGESQGLGLSALLAAGLVLFVVTLLVNSVASFVVSRSRSGAGVEA